MIILEYKLDASPEGMRCPPWIDDGGYWLNGNKMVGVTRDNPEFHIPSTVLRLTSAELITRQLAIHAITPMMKHTDDPIDTPVEMTDAEVTTAIQDWVASK